MTPRYVVSSDNENYAESSPDPLGASFGQDQTRAPSTTQHPLTTTSPSKQNRRPKTTGLDITSPTKHVLLSTPRTAGQSPWRIKVTVQAEPGSDSENTESPIVKHLTHTKTTKVPLKDPDASSPAKRRGRPRKSEAPTKRSGTPVRQKATSKSRRTSVGDNSSAGMEADGTPKKRRGRPRKVQPPAEDDIWGQARRSSVGADASAADVETDATPKKRRGRPRKSIQLPPQEETVLHIEQSAPQCSPLPDRVESELHIDTAPSPSKGDDSQPEMNSTPQERRTRLKSTSIQTGLSRRHKARKNTPMAKDQKLIEISSDEESEEHGGGDGEVGFFEKHSAEEVVDDLDDFEPLQESASGTPEDEEEQHETYFAFEEGATRMPSDTTIIDSENFSMISVDSLPSCASVARPANSAIGGSCSTHNQELPQNRVCLDIPSSSSFGPGSANAGLPLSLGLSLPNPRLPAAAPRYKTPSVEPIELSKPPPVEVARLPPTEAQTPRIGRVVRAGVALQGLLDPNRITPEAGPSKTVDERRDHLDDLFRGFSERTKRELHAGLRLGEQLAKQSRSNQPPLPALSSPIKTMNSDLPAEPCVPSNTVPQQSRLLTPEGQDGDTATISQPVEVQYPVLPHSDQRSGLLSPVSNPEDNEDEMSWRIDTPPVQHVNRAGTQLSAPHQSHLSARIDVPNIWEEEASRPSDRLESDNTSAPGIQDLLAQDAPVKPARGKLPRAWRRKTSDDFQYSDGAEESQIVTPPSESDDSPARVVDKGKGKAMQPPVPTRSENENDDEEVDSEESDDTGMFFQANIPNLFNKQHSSEFRRRRKQKQEDISLNLDQSLLPESSPPPVARTPAMDKPNPFMDTPPQLAALRSSPVKSSPLRQELRGSDISSDPAQQTFEESTLPLAPSSPFHTYVEGDTGFSMASDQRQLLREMAPIDSSLRRIRDEADEYLDAYEPQERSLHNLTEITEPSRTWNKDNTMLTSSPPKQMQRAPGPSFGNGLDKANSSCASSNQDKEDTQQHTDVSDILTRSCSPSMRKRLPPPAHPALAKLDSLPHVEPWTKTHYRALDRLYQLYKKRPAIFSTKEAPNAALNATLLTSFINATTHDFIGARYRAWGYNVIFTDALVVLCATFMQLLTLDSIEAYEKKARKEIQVGDCQPGIVGSPIRVEGVVERLATIVLGEAVRRDEKKGKVVDKSGRLRVEWSQ
ncbi:uncharacterized protein N0V89_001106 [Didymosphaeria variabile]|uniref:Uncharacterized protein n=1 Tax=Didymosphaeria variabile TaxID=1932322 RepID=A0A9W8XWE2_9PLEO|nr:uncharacterized protein N0V89_001106 [Didymosphaeria variabile]KAJ4360541.1 hypothetical protein N0V89_001106 [Didymosphaeria variabile]